METDNDCGWDNKRALEALAVMGSLLLTGAVIFGGFRLYENYQRINENQEKIEYNIQYN